MGDLILLLWALATVIHSISYFVIFSLLFLPYIIQSLYILLPFPTTSTLVDLAFHGIRELLQHLENLPCSARPSK